VIDSSETSEHTNEQTRSGVGVGVGVGEIGVNGAAHILPTSFITSVTSITSLEAGYQGDGENSRPASCAFDAKLFNRARLTLIGTFGFNERK
jgi:hypothetical protein